MKQKVYYVGGEYDLPEDGEEEWAMDFWLEDKFYAQLPDSIKNDIDNDLRYGFYENPRIWIDRSGLTNGEFYALSEHLQEVLRHFDKMFQKDRDRDARLEEEAAQMRVK